MATQDHSEPFHLFGTIDDPGVALPNSAGVHYSDPVILPRGEKRTVTLFYEFTGAPVGDAPYIQVANPTDRDIAEGDLDSKYILYDATDAMDPVTAARKGGVELKDMGWSHIRFVYPHTSGVGGLVTTAYVTRVVSEG